MARHHRQRPVLRNGGRFDVLQRISLEVCESCPLFKRRDNLCWAEHRCINDMGKCPLGRQ